MVRASLPEHAVGEVSVGVGSGGAADIAALCVQNDGKFERLGVGDELCQGDQAGNAQALEKGALGLHARDEVVGLVEDCLEVVDDSSSDLGGIVVVRIRVGQGMRVGPRIDTQAHSAVGGGDPVGKSHREGRHGPQPSRTDQRFTMVSRRGPSGTARGASVSPFLPAFRAAAARPD